VLLLKLTGTYNNQYMVVDLKKVTLSRELNVGTLWVIEQIPGLVVGADQTTILRAGAFCSFLHIVCSNSSFQQGRLSLGGMMHFTS